MQLNKHPILTQWYTVMQAIEECDTSEKLTHAVGLAGSLGNEIEKLVDEKDRLHQLCIDYMANEGIQGECGHGVALNKRCERCISKLP